jgi:uncharacterized membrane protein
MPRKTPSTPTRRTSLAPAAARDWPVAAIAAAGLLVSAYLTVTKLTGAAAAFCEPGSGCDVVQGSRYAALLGLPTAAWGVALYAVVLALALAGFTVRRWQIAFVLAVVAASFSAYLAYVQLVVLDAICAWCVLDALIAVALLGVLVWRRPLPSGRRSPTRPGRLGAVGAVTAVLTIVFAIGAYVGDGPASTGNYREALARHLSQTGAVFYGAYW